MTNKHGIQDENIYNINKIDFLRDDINIAKVVTAADNSRYYIQSNDYDWMTIIKCINAFKRRILVMIIAKEKIF
jgi:hypothetical protein